MMNKELIEEVDNLTAEEARDLLNKGLAGVPNDMLALAHDGTPETVRVLLMQRVRRG